MLKLYDCNTAPSPRRTRILLAEKDMEYECVQVDLRNNEQLTERYREINPRCSVPYLITESGDGISENVAIAIYLEDLKPYPPMIGRTPIEKARTLEWNWRTEFEGFSAVQEILRNGSPKLKGRAMTGPRNIEQLPVLVSRGKDRLEHFFEDLNEQLASNTFVAGEHFSIADISAIVAVDFSKWVKVKPGAHLEAIHKWHATVSDRASYLA